MSSRLLVVHHTPSPPTQALLEGVHRGAALVPDVAVEVRPALQATAHDLLHCDGLLLGTPANIGYMSGALKHFLDQVYYPCLDATVGLPYGLWVHGNDDVAGAVRSVEVIAGAMRWKRAAEVVTVVGAPSAADLERCSELGGTLAALLG